METIQEPINTDPMYHTCLHCKKPIYETPMVIVDDAGQVGGPSKLTEIGKRPCTKSTDGKHRINLNG